MKALASLGISPAPWKIQSFEERRWIVSNEARTICEVKHDLQIRQNTCLIAAAPELYEALREAVCVICNDCGNHFGSKCRNKLTPCYVKKLREVLAKASGEGEVAQ